MRGSRVRQEHTAGRRVIPSFRMPSAATATSFLSHHAISEDTDARTLDFDHITCNPVAVCPLGSHPQRITWVEGGVSAKLLHPGRSIQGPNGLKVLQFLPQNIVQSFPCHCHNIAKRESGLASQIGSTYLIRQYVQTSSVATPYHNYPDESQSPQPGSCHTSGIQAWRS